MTTPPTGYEVPRPAQLPPAPPPPGYVYAQPVSPAGQPLADFGSRLVARLIDGAILGAVGVVILVPIYVVVFATMISDLRATLPERDPQDPFAQPNLDVAAIILPLLGISLIALLVSLVAGYLYQVEMMFRTGQTLGKRAMKIRVVPLDPATALTRLTAAKRYGLELACGLIPGGSLLDGLWQLWDKPYQQCLHDKGAGTVVIKLNP